MTLHTSIVITGDTEAASAAVRKLTSEAETLGKSTRTAGEDASRAAADTAKLGEACAKTAAAIEKSGQDTRGFVAAVEQLQAVSTSTTRTEEAFAAALAKVRTEAEAAGVGTSLLGRVVADAERRFTSGAAAVEKTGEEAGAAGRAMTDAVGGATAMAVSVGAIDQRTASAVGSIADFARSIGSLGSDMGRTQGAGGALAGFLRGPLIGAVSAAIGVISTMATSLLENEEASTRAQSAAEGFASIQGELGRMFELSTGKIRENTAALRANIMTMALRMEQEGIEQRNQALRNLGGIDANWGAVIHDGLRGGVPSAQIQAARQREYVQQIMRRVYADPDNADLAAAAQLVLSRADTSRLNMPGLDIADNVNQVRQAQQNIQSARNAIQSVRPGGTLDESFRTNPPRTTGLGKDRPSGGGGRGRDNSAAVERLAEFGRDAAVRISELGGQFTDTPSQVQRVARALADLDDLLDDIERRKPPGFEDLLQQGREARGVIEDGINQPYRDFLQQQEEALRIGALVAQGRDAEAEALGIILRQEATRGPLLQEQRDTILAGVEAMRLQQRELEILRERQQTFLDALGDTRALLTDTARGVLDGDLRVVRDLPGRLRSIFNDLLSRYLTENLFGGAFRELQDQVTGNNIARDAAERFRDGVIGARRETDDFSGALRGATATLRGGSTALAGGTATSGSIGELFGFRDVAWHDPAITVIGQRNNQALPDPRQFVKTTIETLLTRAGVGGEFAALIGNGVARGLEGAAYGSMAGGLAGGLIGGRQSRTGAALGGAAGNIVGEKFLGGLGSSLGIGGGPLGSIIGGIAGSLLGGLFSGSKRGSATINSVDGPASVTGNSSSFRSAASGMAGNVQDALQTIAEQLGGGVGGFAVSIGVRDGKYRVDPTGRGNTKKKRSVDFGEDQAAAIAYAIADAIADGAITGLSSAVQAALKSSTDVNKALREALKVDELETLLSGADGALNKAFKDFERQAAERVRIARKYGFDVVKLEELNAKERLKMFDDIMASRVGSLQQLLDSLNFGDLFEGSIAEQRQKLLVEVAKAEEAAKAGEEGAADRVAELRRQLLDVTRGGYGTAGGEYAADRASTRTAADEIILLEKERVKDAQEAAMATNQHLATSNSLLNEITNQNAEMIAVLRGLATGGGTLNLTPAVRYYETDRLVQW